MSMGNAAETNLLELIFQNIAWTNIGDAGGLLPSASAGSLYVSLHTADPGEAGDQTTSESAYTNYARVAVARSVAGWTVAGNTVSNAGSVAFPECGASGSTVTHFAVGRASSGAGEIIVSGALSATVVINNLITPSFAIGALTATAD